MAKTNITEIKKKLRKKPRRKRKSLNILSYEYVLLMCETNFPTGKKKENKEKIRVSRVED